MGGAHVEFFPGLGDIELACAARYMIRNLRLAFGLVIVEVGFHQLAGAAGQFQFAGRHLNVHLNRFRSLPVDGFDVVDFARGGLKTERNSGDDQKQDDGNFAATEPGAAGLRGIPRPEVVPNLSRIPEKSAGPASSETAGARDPGPAESCCRERTGPGRRAGPLRLTNCDEFPASNHLPAFPLDWMEFRLTHFLKRASSAACEMASSISDLAPLAAIPPRVWPST